MELGLVDPLIFRADAEKTIEYIEGEINDEHSEPVAPMKKSAAKKPKKKDTIHDKMKQMKDRGTPTDLKKHEVKKKFHLYEVTDHAQGCEKKQKPTDCIFLPSQSFARNIMRVIAKSSHLTKDQLWERFCF